MKATSKPRKTLSDVEALAETGLVARDRLDEIARVAARYAVSLTPEVTELIERANPADPLARQFIPNPLELETSTGETADPIGDDLHSPVEGVVHRYPDRVLLKLVHVCAVYCRFCFRREMVGPGRRLALSPAQISAALDYVRAHPEIWEVILSGGDPLILSARRLREVLRALRCIEHVKIVRVHTRIPAVAPERITADLVRALRYAGKTVYVVLHANHPRELTARARAACARIVEAGIPMLGQSVLLRGVNDDPATLEALMRSFVESRIKPYYLHHCDLAPGTSHLRTTIEEGQALIRTLRGRNSGLCQPSYVLDIPGGHGKSPIGPNFLYYSDGLGGGKRLEIEDYRGRRHVYPPAGKGRRE
jgi:lysine 2,3-aminomutase